MKYPSIVRFSHGIGWTAGVAEPIDSADIKLTPLPEAPQMGKMLRNATISLFGSWLDCQGGAWE